jgi:hypothetical protein
LSRNFNDGPENFAERVRNLQRNTTWEDRQRYALASAYFYRQTFDLRSNGKVKRVGLVLWAVPLLCFGLSACVSVVSYSSLALAVATCIFVGLPALAASGMAIWTACFLRPPAPRNHLRRHQGDD